MHPDIDTKVDTNKKNIQICSTISANYFLFIKVNIVDFPFGVSIETTGSDIDQSKVKRMYEKTSLILSKLSSLAREQKTLELIGEIF